MPMNEVQQITTSNRLILEYYQELTGANQYFCMIWNPREQTIAKRRLAGIQDNKTMQNMIINIE